MEVSNIVTSCSWCGLF